MIDTYTNRTEVTVASWPKCYPCTQRFSQLNARQRAELDIQVPYPVEVYGIVGREAARDPKCKYRLVFNVGCHGKEQQFAVETPRWYGMAMEIVRLGKYVVFVPNGKGGFKVARFTELGWQM